MIVLIRYSALSITRNQYNDIIIEPIRFDLNKYVNRLYALNNAVGLKSLLQNCLNVYKCVLEYLVEIRFCNYQLFHLVFI